MSLKRLYAGQHTCFGHLSENPSGEGEGDTTLERDVLLVYTGEFESQDGPVAVSLDDIHRLAAGHNSRISKFKRLADGGVPLKACPPVQLDHSTRAALTVGRLVGDIRPGVYIDEESGEEKTGLYGRVRVLGRENVEKAKDGRFLHVSVGADFEKGKLNELSFVPFAAAPNASLMSKLAFHVKSKGRYKNEDYRIEFDDETDTYEGYVLGASVGEFDSPSEALKAIKYAVDKGDKKMFAKFAASLKGLFNLSADKDADDKAEKMRGYVMSREKCSAEDAEKKLGEMDDESKKKLAADMDEDEKKMAAEKDAEEKRLAAEKEENEKKLAADKVAEEARLAAEADKSVKLAAAAADGVKLAAERKESFVRLAKGFNATIGKAQVESRKARLSARLSGLRASAKITPAEIKKIDIERLSKESEATVNAVFESYESREPVILAGILGTKKAENLAEFSKQLHRSRLENETRMNMPSKRAETERLAAAGDKEAQARLAAMEPAPTPVAPVEVHVDATPHTHYDMAYDELCRMMDSGDTLGAKTALKALMDKMKGGMQLGDVGPAPKEQEVQMSALADTVKSMHNQFQELVKLVGPQLGVESSEID